MTAFAEFFRREFPTVIHSDFRDLVPDARTIVRGSHPFGVALTEKGLYVVDAGYNSVHKIDLRTGRVRTLTTFAPLPNPAPFGPPFTDAVPDSIRPFRDELLVTFLSGFPFAPGAARIISVDAKTGRRGRSSTT